MINSVMSFPERGAYGRSSYRGNCSGHVQKSLISAFRPAYFVDPAEGSGTSRDVCREMQIKYTGLDLKDGFNLLRDRLRDHVDDQPDFIFFHPPYGGMIQYSGNMWGSPHSDDLSRCRDNDDFMAKIESSLINIYDPLRENGRYAVLIGDMRKNGEYFSWQSDIINMGIGKLQNVLIKQQHNCVSDNRSYNGSFIPINHEYLLVFVKDHRIISVGQFLLDREAKISKKLAGTWKQIVCQAVADLGGRATIGEAVEAVLKRIDAPENRHVAAKVRQILQDPSFNRVAKGQYALN